MRKIPKRFQLGPHTVKVYLVNEKEMAKVSATPYASDEERDDDKSIPWGLWIRGENAIFVQKVRLGFNESQQIHTFWHEYYHALFAMLNKSDLTDNEELVDQCGLLHTQMLQTAKY